MIRFMKMEDLEQGSALLTKHIKDFDFAKDWNEDLSEYHKHLLINLIKDQTVIISEDNGIINGVLMCIKAPSSLNPYLKQLHIIVNWVREDKRGSSIFYRMNKFLNNEFKDFDKVFSCMPSITNIKFEKLGYKKISINYIKERD